MASIMTFYPLSSSVRLIYRYRLGVGWRDGSTVQSTTALTKVQRTQVHQKPPPMSSSTQPPVTSVSGHLVQFSTPHQYCIHVCACMC